MTELQMISPSEIEAASRALISARRTSLGIEVQMPVVYPTGQSVTVVVNIEGGDYIVHDAGFGAMALTSAGVALTQQLRARLSSLARHYGCDFIEGRMSRRCAPEQVALAMALVANASRTVGDQAIEARKRPMAKFKLEMATVVAGVFGQKRVRQDEEIKSDNGKRYRVNALVLSEDQAKPFAFVEAVNDEQAVNRHFREFYDLKRTHRFSGVQRIAIFDNRRHWQPGELSVLDDVSTRVPYSDASRELQRIAA